jgi:hypothetical protein
VTDRPRWVRVVMGLVKASLISESVMAVCLGFGYAEHNFSATAGFWGLALFLFLVARMFSAEGW